MEFLDKIEKYFFQNPHQKFKIQAQIIKKSNKKSKNICIEKTRSEIFWNLFLFVK